MGYELKFVAPSGRSWTLMGKQPNGVFINEGSLSGQLVGSKEETPVIAANRPGQIVSTQDMRTVPIKGTLNCTVSATYSNGTPTVDVWRQFRHDWLTTAPDTLGSLVLWREDGVGKFRLPIRLSGGLPGVESNPEELEDIPISVPYSGDGGQWLLDHHDTGTVTVTNVGQGAVTPKIMWEGAGGEVTLPSGATITLPEITEPRIVDLDIHNSFMVTNTHGQTDYELWKNIRGNILGESIPEKSSRTYILPPGATLIWEERHLDPWR